MLYYIFVKIMMFYYYFVEELESVFEISDLVIEDDEFGVKDEGIYINCVFVLNGDDNKNGSDIDLDIKFLKNYEIEKIL